MKDQKHLPTIFQHKDEKIIQTVGYDTEKHRQMGKKNVSNKNMAGNQNTIAVKYSKISILCNIKKKSSIPSFFFSLIWRLKLVI